MDEDTARARLAELVRRHGDGLSLRGQYTVSSYLDEYLRTARLRATTRSVYEAYARRHIVPRVGTRRLDQLSAQHVRRLLHELVEERGAAASTVRQVHAILSGMLRQAMGDGLVERNVARLVRPPERLNVERQVLSLEEARALRESMRGDSLEALYVLTMTLGLRPGELRGLRWQDVDLGAATLRVAETAQWIKPIGAPGTWVFGPTKTARSRRSLPLSPGLVELLQAHRSRQAEEYLRTGVRPARRLVFAGAGGDPYANDWLSDDFRRRVRALRVEAALAEGRSPASVDRVRGGFYDLRHVAASLMYARGLTPRAVMDVLGHSSYLVTMNVYTHVPAAELVRTLADADTWFDLESKPAPSEAGGSADGGGSRT